MPNSPQPTDPESILGVRAGASDEEIRAAYLGKVKQYPPDRSPAEFELVRDAYEVLRDPRRRAQQMILAKGLSQPLTALVDGFAGLRRFVGLEPWIDALKDATPPKERQE